MQLSDWEENIVGKEDIARYNFSFSHNILENCLL